MMQLYHELIILIILSAAFAYINTKLFKLPFVIGLFLLSTIASVIVIIAEVWFGLPNLQLKDLIANAHIETIVIDVFLGFLLFAGGLHTNWEKLKSNLRSIAIFALAGVIMSTLIIGGLFFFITQALGLNVDIIFCFLFGALIAPTDPIAVIGILSKAKIPKSTEVKIVGESLFNDGVGVVIFVAILDVISSGTITFSSFILLFIQEAIGGILAGLILGYTLHLLMKTVDHYETEVLLTLAFVMAGYPLCNHFHISGALAMVVMGLMAGNFKQQVAMSDVTTEYVHKFWELLDVILNALLFILIALVLLFIDFKMAHLLLGAASIIIVLLARIIIVYVPHKIMPNLLRLTNKEAKIIVWGGLRGGLSLALVLSLPQSEFKNILLVATYSCVLFSILVQGLTIEKLIKVLK